VDEDKEVESILRSALIFVGGAVIIGILLMVAFMIFR
jgi:hypothetical protein|tara:strand:- start:10048 stop:10158 length:111 start_codon:yes stop_codon:yes gene_type:complete